MPAMQEKTFEARIMTTSTTDAEAIARIIRLAMYDGSASEGPDELSRIAGTYASAILSYLASRREVEEPVAWRWRFVDEKNWTICETRPKQADDCDVWCEPLYTAPPAPAGEIERLRGALEIARGVHFKAASIASGLPKEDPEHLRWLHHSYGADEVAYKIDAALNGGRADE